MMNPYKLTVLFVFSILSGTAMAQDTLQLSLQDAMEYARKNNPALQNAKTDVELAQQKVREVQAIGLPQINATANFQQYVDIPGQWIKNAFGSGGPDYIFLQFAQKYSSNASVTASQLIADGTYLLGLRAAREFVNVNNLLVAKSENDLTANVSKAYYLALMSRETLRLLDQNLKTLGKTLSDTREVYKAGFAEITDVQRLELSYSNLQIQRDNMANAAETTLKILRLQMGMDVNAPVKLTDNLEDLNRSLVVEVGADAQPDVKARPEYQLLQQSLLLSRYDEKRYKVGYLPSLAGFFSHQQSTNRPEFNFFKSGLTPNNNWVSATLWGLNLSVPIFDGFRKNAQMKQVLLNRRKTENDLRTFENAAGLEFYQARNKFQLSRLQAEQQKKNLALAEEIYGRTTEKYKNGVGSITEVLLAENDMKAAQTNYLNAIYDLLVSKIDLQKAMGSKIAY